MLARTGKSVLALLLERRCLRAIAAVAENKIIGFDNKLPWWIRDEAKWFRRMTYGSTVIFGRKTFESLGRALPNRANIVLSRSNIFFPGAQVIHSLEELANFTNDAWVCGGAEIYQQLLPACCELYVSTIRGRHEGDRVFPEYESMFLKDRILLDTDKFYVTRFVNKLSTDPKSMFP